MSKPDLSKVTAGEYELIVLSWDEVKSKPGQPFDYVTHRKGDKVNLNVEQARRLVSAGAVKPVKKRASGQASQQQSAPPAGGDGVAVVDADGKAVNIDDVVAAVGNDPAKAKATLEAEKARGDAVRSTLVSKLEAVIAAAEGGQGS